jgi:type III pantothenate kinase
MLLIDIGNTRLKWATCENGVWSEQQACIHKSVTDYATLFTQLWEQLPQPNAVWAVNVAGTTLADALNNWTQQHWNCTVHFAQSQPLQCGIRNDYDYPTQLGSDRWLAVIAARQVQSTGQICVVDCGTAVTIDVVTADNHYVGGLIAPGRMTMQQGLFKHTDALAELFQPPNASPQLTATNTTQGIQSGCLYAEVGLINYVYSQLQQPTTLILTGGGAAALRPWLPNAHYLPDLVLHGLWTVACTEHASQPN